MLNMRLFDTQVCQTFGNLLSAFDEFISFKLFSKLWFAAMYHVQMTTYHVLMTICYYWFLIYKFADFPLAF